MSGSVRFPVTPEAEAFIGLGQKYFKATNCGGNLDMLRGFTQPYPQPVPKVNYCHDFDFTQDLNNGYDFEHDLNVFMAEKPDGSFIACPDIRKPSLWRRFCSWMSKPMESGFTRKRARYPWNPLLEGGVMDGLDYMGAAFSDLVDSQVQEEVRKIEGRFRMYLRVEANGILPSLRGSDLSEATKGLLDWASENFEATPEWIKDGVRAKLLAKAQKKIFGS